MQLTTFLITCAFLQVSGRGLSQTITWSGKDVPLKKVFTVIKEQTGYVVFSDEKWISAATPVSIRAINLPLADFLDAVLKDQPFEYNIESKTITITPKPTVSKSLRNPSDPVVSSPPPIEIHGRVTDSLGNPLAGASITIKGTKKGVQTDANGAFVLKDVDDKTVLLISFTGFGSREVAIRGRKTLVIVLTHAENPLDEIQVIAYGTTTRRLNTGDVSSITAEQIARQPVSNVLAAMEGLAPGLSVSQSDGLPGGYFSVSIRGTNALHASPSPLFIVDGVPFINTTLGGFPGTNNESSPLNTINPGDIERIDILKDADATAIYGSRGADGVILITTKKGKAGKTGLTLNAYSGITNATRLMKWLNGKQYLEMRREAFKNDGITPNISNAPDLVAWDTTRDIDWQKLLLGGTAHTSEVQAALNGGTGNTLFRVASSFHHETPLYAASPHTTKQYGYNRGSFSSSLSHTSLDNKFSIGVNAQYTVDKSNYSNLALGEVPLPPDAPQPFDQSGNLNWNEGGASFDNPFGSLRYSYDIKNNNLLASTDLKYTFLPGFSAKVNMGYNKIENSGVESGPKSAQDPTQDTYSYSRLQSNQHNSWIIEPQLEYINRSGIGKFDVLAGATWQDQGDNNTTTSVSDYSSDIYLGTLLGAGNISTTTSSSHYRYNAFYGRINYDYEEKYLLNLTGRRDGSSRFGPGRQFANFGAVGAAWIFTKEEWFQRFKFLSFGKLRGSYGITGSDNIGDYQYIDTWYSYSGYSYDGGTGVTPNNLNNPDYAWETNRKLEGGLELGFLKDRILLTTSLYRNRSGNQLINYSLPSQTGFTGVLENFPATVQNTGLEITLNTTNVKTKFFRWSTSFNMSINRNKLVAFPGLDSSSYASRYIIGKPITISNFFQSLGVNPATGVYQFNGTDFTKDRNVVIDANGPPRFYGSLDNRFSWKGWELALSFQFSRSNGQGYASRMTSYGAPGTMNNQPVYVLARWQKPGDITSVQRFTTAGSASAAFNTYGRESDGSIVDVSFVRFKNLSLAYNFSTRMLKTMKMRNVRAYLQGQNLGIITGYKGADPESHGIGNPLMRVWTGGIQFDF